MLLATASTAWALPSELVRHDEALHLAARRALAAAHLIPPDAATSAEWWPVASLPVLVPDQRRMIDYALTRLRNNTTVGFQLLPPRFTLSELQRVHEVILGRDLDKRNFHRKVDLLGIVNPTREQRASNARATREQRVSITGRPAQLYRFFATRHHGHRATQTRCACGRGSIRRRAARRAADASTPWSPCLRICGTTNVSIASHCAVARKWTGNGSCVASCTTSRSWPTRATRRNRRQRQRAGTRTTADKRRIDATGKQDARRRRCERRLAMQDRLVLHSQRNWVLLYGDRLMVVLISIRRSPAQQQPVLACRRKWPLPHLVPFDDGDAAQQIQIFAFQ